MKNSSLPVILTHVFLVVVILAFGCLGLTTDSKGPMFFAYLGVFSVSAFLVFLVIRKTRVHALEKPSIVKTIFQAIGFIFLLLALASVGFGHENPKLMVPVFFIFFVVIFASVLLYVHTHKEHSLEETAKAKKIKHYSGIALIIFSAFIPALILKSAGFSIGIYLLISLITAVLIVVSGIAIIIINNAKGKKLILEILGYVMLVAISTVPAIAMIQYDNSYNALGTAYYAAILVAIASWWGFALYSKKDD